MIKISEFITIELFVMFQRNVYKDRQSGHIIHASTNLLASMLVYTSECPTAYRLVQV